MKTALPVGMLLVLLLVMLLTACGGGDPEPDESVRCYIDGVRREREVCDGPRG